MSEWRRYIFLFLLVVSFSILLVRLIDVSLIRGGYYNNLSRQNRIRTIPIFAPRGNILDRHGNILATNLESFRILRFEEGQAPQYVDWPGIKEIDKQSLALRDKQSLALRDKEVKVSFWKRVYPTNEIFAHLMGYLTEASQEEVGKAGCNNTAYILGDFIGRVGVEEAFDCLLRGKNGEELVEVDSRGNKIRVLGRREPQKGQDITLAVDLGLQEKAVEALDGQTGSVVVLDPRNGEILALVSSPSFNPNQISALYNVLAVDQNKPLFNRTIGGQYPPGSTFKIVTAAAGLEEGKVDEKTTFIDTGIISLGSFNYTNWYFTQYGRTEGEIDLVRAITRSTDTFFYKLGEWAGVDKLGEWAKKFGLGAKTGIDIDGETSGLVPSSSWKERVKGERWFLGNTYHMSIGQGDVGVSPLQIAVMTGVIANNGELCKPTVQKVESGKWKVENCTDVGLSQETIELITRGMVGACSTGGTAFPLFNFTPQVACKTGTAEFGDPKERTHAWLTAFAPASSALSGVEGSEASAKAGAPIVVTALIEAGGEGSRVAAPVVRQVLEYWFKK